MAYSWSAKNSLDVRTVTKRIGRVETHDAEAISLLIASHPEIKASLKMIQPCGPGSGVSHYDLMAELTGNDWELERLTHDAYKAFGK